MSNVISVTSATFDEVVLKSTVPVLVDFWAPWCGPCVRIGPELDAVSLELGDSVKIVKVNVDDETDLSGSYEIQSIPAMLIFKNGELVDRLVGLLPRTAISAKLKVQI